MEEFVAGIFCRGDSDGKKLVCESCNVVFTLFKRKRVCCICQQYFCRDCLSSNGNGNGNSGSTTSLIGRLADKKLKCRTCKVLSARPLDRELLMQQRIRDLRRYLNSLNVSTTGCVEKKELVDLLIRHVALTSYRESTPHRPQPQQHPQPQPQPHCAPASNYTPSAPSAQEQPPPSAEQGQESEYDVSSPPDSEVDGFVIVENYRSVDIIEVSEGSNDGTLSDSGVEPLVTEEDDMDGVQTSQVFVVLEPENAPDADSMSIVEDVGVADSQQDASVDMEVPPMQRNAVSLNDISSLSELESMPVKSLKELLLRNRVDFRGCCEKGELLERASRLWNDNAKARECISNLPMDELCKVCMDAPVECVMLECGHMATCTDCGKQLSECPICRQYVVRIVRTFKA